MPLYEYECQQCHRRLEKIQKFSDPELTVCPHCAGLLERTVTAPSFQFSGGGWYADGYGNAKPSTPGESNPAPASTKTETAPAATPAASSPAAPGAPAAAPAASNKT